MGGFSAGTYACEDRVLKRMSRPNREALARLGEGGIISCCQKFLMNSLHVHGPSPGKYWSHV